MAAPGRGHRRAEVLRGGSAGIDPTTADVIGATTALVSLSAAPDGTKTPESTAAHLAGLAARGLVTLGAGRNRRSTRKGLRLDARRSGRR